MRRRPSNWGSYQQGRRNTPVGSRARARQAAAATRRGGAGLEAEPHTGFWQKVKGLLTKPAVFVTAAVTVGVGAGVTTLAENAVGGLGRHIAGLFTSDTATPKPTVESITPLPISGGGTVMFAKPLHLTERQIVADTNSLTGPGVLPDDTAVQVMVRNPAQDTVYVTNVQVNKTCTAPLSGTVLYDPPQGGNGGDSDIGIGFDLDSSHPVPRNFSADGLKLGGGYFLDRTVAILPGEPQTFLLYTRTSHHYCRFRFVMTVHVDGQIYRLTIDHKGKPFEITAGLIDKAADKPTLGAYQVAYVPGYQARMGTGSGMSATTRDFAEVDPKTWKEQGSTKR